MQVIKHGYAYDVDRGKPIFHSCECSQCGCRIGFTYNDLLYAGMEYYLNRARAIFHIVCPECKTIAYSTYGEMRAKDND